MPLGLILGNYLPYIKNLFGDAATIHYDSARVALVHYVCPNRYPLTFIIDRDCLCLKYNITR